MNSPKNKKKSLNVGLAAAALVEDLGADVLRTGAGRIIHFLQNECKTQALLRMPKPLTLKSVNSLLNNHGISYNTLLATIIDFENKPQYHEKYQDAFLTLLKWCKNADRA